MSRNVFNSITKKTSSQGNDTTETTESSVRYENGKQITTQSTKKVTKKQSEPESEFECGCDHNPNKNAAVRTTPRRPPSALPRPNFRLMAMGLNSTIREESPGPSPLANISANGMERLAATPGRTKAPSRDQVITKRKTTRQSINESRSSSPEDECDCADGVPLITVTPTDQSFVHEEVVQETNKGLLQVPYRTASGKAVRVTRVPIPAIVTPAGKEPVVHQISMEKRVERTPAGEHVTHYMSGVKANNDLGEATQMEIESRQTDPKTRLHTGALKEVISISSSMAITRTHAQAQKNVLREIKSIDTGLGVDPEQLAQLVNEETDDVEATMKMLPPDLVENSPQNYSLKKRLQQLRLNNQNIVALEQTVVHPKPTADEDQGETPPETLATIMHSVERGVTPLQAPNKIFKTLFKDVKEQFICQVSSVLPGMGNDVVIPTDITDDIVEEPMDKEMEQTVMTVQSTIDKPKDDLYVTVRPCEPKTAMTFNDLDDRAKRVAADGGESLPWDDEAMKPFFDLSGVIPADEIETLDLDKSGPDCAKENLIANGIEYFLDAEPVQYSSRVQLRGSQPPGWFPGYMLALPDLPEVVEVVRKPSEVLLRAWKAVQPKLFPGDSIIVSEA